MLLIHQKLWLLPCGFNPTNEIRPVPALGAAPPAEKCVYKQNATVWQSHTGFIKIHSKMYSCFIRHKTRAPFIPLGCGRKPRTQCTLNVWNVVKRGSRDHQVLPLHLKPAEERFSSPITQRAEMPLAAAEPKDISSVHFKGALDYVRAQSILRGSFEGKLSAEPLVATPCVCVCVCLSKPIFLTAFATMLWHWEGPPLSEV